MKDNHRGERNKYFDNPGFMGILGECLEYKLTSSFYRAYVAEFGLKGNEKVLDFGCGGGSCARHLARALRKNGSLTCVDTSKFWLARAEKRMKGYSRLEFKRGDIRTLDIEEAAYDLINIHFVLHDIEQNLRKEILQTLAAKLKSGGRIAVREPVKEKHGIPPEEIRNLMVTAGLKETAGRIVRSRISGPMFQGVFTKPG